MLLAGFSNPINYVYDLELLDRERRLEVKYKLPYSDAQSLSDEALEAYLAKGWPLEFSHTLDDQIGGRLAAGFLIARLLRGPLHAPRERSHFGAHADLFRHTRHQAAHVRRRPAMIEPNAWIIGLNEIIRLLFAVFIGGLIGIERELHYKAAGFRTMMLICVGAALFTMFSIRIGGPSDPARIAAQIVTGVGFIGAGVILHEKGEVRGITTAASIWAAAALGIGIGAGYLLFAGDRDRAAAICCGRAAVVRAADRPRPCSRAYTSTPRILSLIDRPQLAGDVPAVRLAGALRRSERAR